MKDAMTEGNAAPAKGGRLESLDVLRGFDMFFIFLPDPAPCIIFVFLAMIGLGDTAFAAQFDHVRWSGLHFYDCIFPLFLFIAGVTWPYSLANQRAKGSSDLKISLKILRRSALLFLLGAMVQTKIDGLQETGILQFDWQTFRVWSVIGRIGIAWGVSAFLYLWFGRRSRIMIAIAILLGMWALMRFAVAPGAPDGVNPLIDRQWMWARWFDTNFLTTAHRAEGGVATITMVVTAMFGVFAGEILRSEASPSRKALNLLGYSALLTVCGLAVAFAFGGWSMPIVKGIWSSSFALVAGGISATLLAAFYWMIDIKGWRRWGFFFKVIGMNAITIYILVRTILPYEFEKAYFFGGISKYLSPEVAEFVSQAGLIALGWLLLLYLYRKKIFLRV